MKINAPWQLTYHDGNGNRYHFWKEAETEPAHLKYDPVTPAESSSGVYSGGLPSARVLTPEQAETLWTTTLALAKNESLHTNARTMGSGSFNYDFDDIKRRFICRSVNELKDFDSLMAQFRGR